ncbi:hypothetical protein NUM_36370 [Actinocatenispora comari]|uniref:Uncharacterized protein n=1 Tax=Actinocatenispora comari TaxID=2807577 RepID=A0A8J4AGR5_9ACTN|nr:hypothetical protein NUM_36370 [Actinocatenispora comari]
MLRRRALRRTSMSGPGGGPLCSVTLARYPARRPRDQLRHRGTARSRYGFRTVRVRYRLVFRISSRAAR